MKEGSCFQYSKKLTKGETWERDKEEEIKKGGKISKKKKNYENKITQTNKLIILTLSKEANLSKIGDDNEMSKKLMKSWNLWKELEKRSEIYINRDSVCLYNENKKKKKRYFFIKKKVRFGSGERGNYLN